MAYPDDYTDSGTYSKADQQRRLAQLLAAQGSSMEPIASGWQGAAKLAQALAGVMGNRMADQRDAAARAQEASDLAQMLQAAAAGGGGAAVPDTGPATTGSIPAGGGGGGGIGSDYAASMTPEEAIVRTVAGEAAGEPAEGQAAVASVILNRAKQSGQSPQRVVLAKNQFEPWSRNPQRLMALTRDSPKYQQILANIQPALQGQDVTGGATHFYAPKAQASLGRSTPAWARGPYQDIGNHRFFKLAGGPTGQPETAAAPGTVPVGSAPSPDVAAFLGQGTQANPRVVYPSPQPTPPPVVPAGPGALTGSGTRPGPGYVPAPAPIGRGAVAQPVPGTPMPTRPTVTGYPNIPGAPVPALPSNDPMAQPSAVSPPDALGRTTPGATGPVAMPQPIQQGGHALMAQQPPAPLPQAGRGLALLDPSAVPSSIDAPAAQQPVPGTPSSPIDARIAQAAIAGTPTATDLGAPRGTAVPELPRARPVAPLPSMPPGQLLTAPIQPAAAPVARTSVPRPAPAVASPVVPSPAGPATTAAIPQQRGQIFREPAMSAQEFARQGQNYLTGRPSFRDQARVAPRTMQGGPGTGGAPAAAGPVSPRQGLIQRLFGGGGGGGATAPQAAPAGSAVAGAGQPGGGDPRYAAMARLMASGKLPAAMLPYILPKPQEPTKYGFTTMPDGTLVRTNPDTGAATPTGVKGTKRDIQNDANGVPRYTDTGEPVYPGDTGTGEAFSGKSGEIQGVNYLIAQGKLTKEQGANILAGKVVTDADGSLIFVTPNGLVRQTPDGKTAPAVGGDTAEAPAVGGDTAAASPAPDDGNIHITAPKPTAVQAKAAGYADRMVTSGQIVSELEQEGTSYRTSILNKDPTGWTNFLMSAEGQRYSQAKRDWINAKLRPESGAVIGEAEFQNADRQYFPQPGDDQGTIDAKRRNREVSEQGLIKEAGPAYKPPAKAASSKKRRKYNAETGGFE